MALLEVEGLCFSYPGADVPTLQDVAFSVESCGSLALLGSSGAGKTTLLNLLSGLLPCTTGRIAFDGVDVAAVGAARRGVAGVSVSCAVRLFVGARQHCLPLAHSWRWTP